jgi:PAS domain-containing protein
MAVDITARLQAEEALRKAHDELEEEVKKRTAELAVFRRFAEASGQGFGMADFDGRISYVNPTLCRWLGDASSARTGTKTRRT